MSGRLFGLGRVVITPTIQDALGRPGNNPDSRGLVPYRRRHAAGDWDDLDPQIRAANDQALVADERLLSAYHLPDGTWIWIITEADRTVTTVLCPEDY